MAWDCTTLYAKIKELTGDDDLTDASLLVKINHFYQNVLPLEFHLESLESTVTTPMVSGTESYTVDPNSCFAMTGPAYIDQGTTGYLGKVRFRTDRGSFWMDFPQSEALGTPDMQLPSQVLFDRNFLYPRPIPDDAYSLMTEGYMKPAALALAADTPTEELWGPVLAYDVSMDILFDRQDTDPIEGLSVARKFYAGNIVTKEIMRLRNTRAVGSF